MAVSDFLESFPKVSPRAIVSPIPATACCACCEPHAARRVDVLEFPSRWHTIPRCVPEPQLQREICVQPRDRKTFFVRPACRFLNASRFIDLIKASVTIRLQSAGKAAQVRLRMFAFAIR